MKIFLAGATGATGSLVLRSLINKGHTVVAVVRSKDRIPEDLQNHPQLHLTEASLLDLSDAELKNLLTGCEGIAVCLGHNMSLKGIYGKPRKLVRDAVVKLCNASDPTQKLRFVLMNTSGNRNAERNEKLSVKHKMVVGLLRGLLPPHTDNEQAAAYLQKQIGKNHPHIEWAVVRPDKLIDESEVTAYSIHPSPTRDPIFNAGQTSRINVADFMVSLLIDDVLWGEWKREFPVIYNQAYV